MIVTVAEHKEQAVRRLKDAATSIEALLSAYARRHGGNFVVFGSFARGDIRPDSDFDVVVVFHSELAGAAREAVETICADHGLIADVHLDSEVSDALTRRIVRDGLWLP